LSVELIDSNIEEIPTPALLINLEAMDKNLGIMAKYYESKPFASLLPHQKGHRLPIIARKQISAGAKGVSITSLGLAEYYTNCGIKDILITNKIYGDNKIKRVCQLSKEASIILSVDNVRNIKHISEIALSKNTRIDIAAEIYMGTGSSGIEIDKADSLTRNIVKYKGVNFRGFWWHQNSLASIKNFEDRKNRHFNTLNKVATLKDEIEDAGINVEMLSGGYTCTWNITPEYPHLKNIGVQAGSYVFSDWCSHEIEGLQTFNYALTVLTRCISIPKPGEAIFDFGLNSCSNESTYDYHRIVGPMFKDTIGIKSVNQREEISSVVFDQDNTKLKVGNLYQIIPPHSDTTAKLHNKYYCIRKNIIENIWINYGRGLL
jgi:D-serine deaminase-like pyridoxal phosphate-dependent protein